MAFVHHLAAFTLTAAICPISGFVSWRKFFARNQAPEISEGEAARIKLILRLELVAIALILFPAAMMARGIGMM
jgi:uncharacterized membrane protein